MMEENDSYVGGRERLSKKQRKHCWQSNPRVDANFEESSTPTIGPLNVQDVNTKAMLFQRIEHLSQRVPSPPQISQGRLIKILLHLFNL